MVKLILDTKMELACHCLSQLYVPISLFDHCSYEFSCCGIIYGLVYHSHVVNGIVYGVNHCLIIYSKYHSVIAKLTRYLRTKNKVPLHLLFRCCIVFSSFHQSHPQICQSESGVKRTSNSHLFLLRHNRGKSIIDTSLFYY